MPRYPRRSWRAFDPSAAHAGPVAALPRPVAGTVVRILGLDPGSRRTGFGVIECHGSDYVHLAHGCIVVAGLTMPERLRQIFQVLQGLMSEHEPAEIARTGAWSGPVRSAAGGTGV